MVLFIADKLVL